jgi:hypothetical protein
MDLGEELSNIQRVALEGEVSYVISTSIHDADMKYRIYCIFRETEGSYREYLLRCFKETTTFNEEEINKIYFEAISDKVPVWIWSEKVIADIKESVRLAELSVGSKLSVDKKEAKKKIAESAFVNFIKKAFLISVDATEQLLNDILEDPDLSFLHTSAFFLRSSCEEVRDAGNVQDKVSEEIMHCHYDIKDIMNFRVLSEAFNILNEKELLKREKPVKSKIRKTTINITPDMTEEEISELISNKVLSTFKELSGSKSKLKYVVNKVFNDTQISTTIRTCNTREEAEKFIEKIKKEYPDLTSTCEFFISEEKEDSRWQTKDT